jgi:hypothetical protein
MCGVSGTTFPALPAGWGHADADPIALANGRNIFAHSGNRPCPFMTAYGGVVGGARLECMQIRTANAAMRDLDDGLSRIGDGRRELLEFDLLMPCYQSGLHRASSQCIGNDESFGGLALLALSQDSVHKSIREIESFGLDGVSQAERPPWFGAKVDWRSRRGRVHAFGVDARHTGPTSSIHE